jgi:hypothetical protein
MVIRVGQGAKFNADCRPEQRYDDSNAEASTTVPIYYTRSIDTSMPIDNGSKR